MTDRYRESTLRRGIAQIVLVYAVFASAWILFSDMAVEALFEDTWQITLASLLKGWLFVGVTTLLLYVLMRRLFGGGERAPGAAPAGLAPGLLVNWPAWAFYVFAIGVSIATLWLRQEVSVVLSGHPCTSS